MATATTPRQLWQLPVFVLGLAAAVAAGKYAPTPTPDPAAMARSALAEFARTAARRPVDLAAVESLTHRAVELADAAPAAANPAHYLAGSGYVVLAAHGPPEASADNWKLAASHLARCDARDLPDPEDGKRLAYRIAAAGAALGTGNQAEHVRVLSAPPANEDTAEAPRLIAAAALRQTPPDAKRAKDELSRYLSLPHGLPAAAAAKVKVDLAELHLVFGEGAAARKWLQDVGDVAPGPVKAQAQLRLAQLTALDNNFPEAAKLYAAALENPDLPVEQRGPARLRAGVVMARSNDPAAAKYLADAVQEPGVVGAAAAVRLAELRAKEKGRRGEAAELLEKAAAAVRGADDLAAADLPPAATRKAFEEVIALAAAEGDFAAASRAAAAYTTVAEPGKDTLRKAEVSAAWATALEKTTPADAPARHRAAAAAFATLANTAAPPAKRAEYLKAAVTHFRKAGATADALAAADKLLASAGVPAEDLGRAWLDRAELLPASDTANISASLTKAMQYPGPAAASARLKLAVTQLNEGKRLAADAATKAKGEQMAKFARGLLSQIADAASVTPAEKTAHEEAVFQLGSQLMGEGQFADAESRFRKLLQLYPDGPLAGYGKLWLACCLVQQAGSAEKVAPTDPRLAEAIELLKPLQTSTDPFVRSQAEIRTLNTLVVQQKYDAVLTRGAEIQARYKGKPDALVVGKLMFYAVLEKQPYEPGEALKVVLGMEEAFAALTAADFPTDPEYSHARWKKELPALRAEMEKRKK